MAKKNKPALPSGRSIEMVLTQAANAPLQNMQHAAAVDAALKEVTAYFRALLQPSESQASARAGGSASDQA
jgi:hypothetical protein